MFFFISSRPEQAEPPNDQKQVVIDATTAGKTRKSGSEELLRGCSVGVDTVKITKSETHRGTPRAAQKSGQDVERHAGGDQRDDRGKTQNAEQKRRTTRKLRTG